MNPEDKGIPGCELDTNDAWTTSEQAPTSTVRWVREKERRAGEWRDGPREFLIHPQARPHNIHLLHPPRKLASIFKLSNRFPLVVLNCYSNGSHHAHHERKPRRIAAVAGQHPPHEHERESEDRGCEQQD